MKKNILRLITPAIVILLAAAACQIIAPPPTVITNENAAQLGIAAQVSTGEMLSDLVWANDSSSITALAGTGASRLDTETLEVLDDLSFETSAQLYAASPDGKTVAFSEDSYNIFLVDFSVTANALSIYSPDWLSTIDFSPDGATLLATSLDQIRVTLWDTASGEQVQTISGFETAAPVYSAKFGEDGKHILWISRGRVQLSDISSQQLGPEFSHEDFVVSAVLSPDGGLLATAAAGTVDGTFTPAIFLWDAASGELTAILANGDMFNAIAFSPDGSLIAASIDGAILIWDTVAQEKAAEIPWGSDSIYELAFSPNGAYLAAGSLEGDVAVWKIE